MDDAYWGGKKNDGIRGRGATGKMPFVAALALSEKGHPLFIKLNQVQQFTLKEISGRCHQLVDIEFFLKYALYSPILRGVTDGYT